MVTSSLHGWELDATLFYHHLSQVAGTEYILALPSPFEIRTRRETGRAWGGELIASRQLSPHWAVRGSYRYRQKRTTQLLHSPRVNARRVEIAAEDDRHHTLATVLSLNLRRDHASPLLRTVRADALFSLASGLPYTGTSEYEWPSVIPNSSRLPATTSLDLVASKTFDLGGLDLTLRCDVLNALDTRNVVAVHSATGEPDSSGVTVTPYEFAPGLAFGDTDYHPFRDADHDGYVTRIEAYQSYMRAYRVLTDPPEWYGRGRQVRLGVSLSF